MFTKILKSTYDFSNIKKLIHYDWKDVFSKIIPKNKTKVSKESYEKLFIGSILLAASTVLSAVIAFILGLVTTGGILAGLLIGALITGVLFGLIWPGAIFTYNMVTKDKEQTTWVHFILAIIIAITLIFNVVDLVKDIIGLFAFLPFTLIFGIFTIAFLYITVMGNLSILVGCIDTCVEANSTINASTNTQAVETQSKKFCTNCGKPVSGKFCENCGAKVE